MSRFPLLARPLLAGAILLSCGACAESSDAGSQPAAEQEQVISASRVKLYSSVAQLSAESKVIVVAEVDVTPPVEETIAKVPFTLTPVVVSAVVRGDAIKAGDVLQVRVVGGRGVRVIGQQSLQPGERYLLFLEEYSGPSDSKGTQFVTIGATAGLYRSTGKQDEFSRDFAGRCRSPRQLDHRVRA